MNRPNTTLLKIIMALVILCLRSYTGYAQATVIQHIAVIDGAGKPVKNNQDVYIVDSKIKSITASTPKLPAGATVIDATGKTMMPLIIDAHAHLGLLKDTTMSSANYTTENIIRHLKRFQDYGVGAVLCMGTDHTEIFDLRKQSQAGTLPGATIYTAGIGFGVQNGVPPVSYGMDHVYRPETVKEAREEVRQIAAGKPDVIKIWVDDFWGKYPKMDPEIYEAIINEAHKHDIRVAAHLYYLADARKLVNAGVDIIAHSVRDSDIDNSLLKEMKQMQVVYIPTLSLDEFAYIYEGTPDWTSDPFFKASLEPHVYDMINSQAYKDKVKNNPVTPKETAALQTALRNVKKVYDAGITIALGTDAGAQPIRAMGFSEHMELELMVKAGIPILQTIKIATSNGANVLRIDNQVGTIERGKKADFIILGKSPVDDIINSRTIEAVWKDGKQVSKGPLK